MTTKIDLHSNTAWLAADELKATQSEAEVAVVGSLHLDILVNAPDRPKKDETLPGTAWRNKAGGKGGNQAVAASQFGARTAMIGRVGSDDFGERLLAHLSGHGVDISHVHLDHESDSGMSVAIIDKDGDYGAVIVSGANLRISAADVEDAEEVFKKAKVLVLQNEISNATNVAAAELAKRHHTYVILNAAPARPMESVLSKNIDLLVVNALEAEMLSGIPVTDSLTAGAAAETLRETAAQVVVTAGAAGLAIATHKGDSVLEAAYPVQPIDTHGAGDTFIGALAARLAGGTPLLEAARFANAAAALFVSAHPDNRGNLTATLVAQFVANYHSGSTIHSERGL
jgi:ribokinase